ncbi:MAG: hypothetical protein HY608_09845, partial [Planctomycetes bacterium]|nr:hypothetical protein [Planctomycetota bacterium]
MKATTSRSIRRLAVGTLLVSGLVRPVLAKSPAPSFEDRVRAESVIQRVYYAHQIDAPLPFDEVFTRAVLEDRVRTYLRNSVALETLWDTRVTRGMLRAELRRMWRGSRMPERLQEIAAALDNDPALLLECLARPVLVDRLARSFFALDTSLHSESSRAAEALRQQLIDGRIDPLADRVGRRVIDLARDDEGYDAWLTRAGVRDRRIGPVVEGRERYTISVVLERRGDGMTVAVFTVEKRTWDDWWAETSRSLGTEPPPAFGDGLDGPAQHDLLEASSAVSGCAADTWNNGSLDDSPDAREGHTAVWTGSLLLVWGGMNSGIRSQRGARYDPATDTWSPMAMAGGPTPRNEHVAVWTGRVMIVWGGSDGMGRPVTGGRYDPVTDTWSATSVVGAPPSLYWPTAMWTGKVMLVWGYRGGGRYDPAADSWTSLSTIGSPPPIRAQKAVWTGSAMLIWGGLDCTSICAPVNRGWAYDPVADAWSTLSTLFAPEARLEHSMVWTGQEMIVWGGHPNTYVGVDTGGRYDPSTDRWTPMSTANAPSPRYGHTAVWTGSDMVVWGSEGAFNTGGRYNPVLDRWTPTSLSGAPSGRKHHSATWSGQRMIVWGGTGPNGGQYASGGRYDPVGDTWTPTSLGGAPAGRMRHSSVWTGNLLIVWGGSSPDAAALDTGGRYDPVTDAWTPTSIPSLPSARASHTAVWTGQEMVAWGGDDGLGDLSNGRRYDPATDTWRGMSDLNTPSARSLHTAVWTGRDMIVWGGYPSVNTGGRYDPATDSWSPTFLAGAPSARRSHSAVWTGSLMVIWGGQNGNTLLNTGGRYDPTTNTWTPTSTTGPPIARASHGAVWSGQSMIIWGGLTNTGFCGCDRATNTGAIYNPIANTWSSMSTAN